MYCLPFRVTIQYIVITCQYMEQASSITINVLCHAEPWLQLQLFGLFCGAHSNLGQEVPICDILFNEKFVSINWVTDSLWGPKMSPPAGWYRCLNHGSAIKIGVIHQSKLMSSNKTWGISHNTCLLSKLKLSTKLI